VPVRVSYSIVTTTMYFSRCCTRSRPRRCRLAISLRRFGVSCAARETCASCFGDVRAKSNTRLRRVGWRMIDLDYTI